MHFGAVWAVTATLFVVVFASACQSEKAADPGNEAPSGVETPKPDVDPEPSEVTPGSTSELPGEPSTAVGPDVAAGPGDVAEVPASPPDTRDLLTYMNEEVAPRLGRPEERDALVEALRSVPGRVDAPFDAHFSEVLRDLPEEGSVASTCKTCHVQHRLTYRAAHSANSDH